MPPPSPSPSLFARIVDASPPRLSAYLRLIRFEKPNGTLLLFIPCLWGTTFGTSSLAMATHMTSDLWVAAGSVLPPVGLSLLFLTGAFVMRSAGCIINDMWDMQFDRNVARTKGRPIANGDVTQTEAFLYLTAHLVVGLLVCLSLNDAALGTAIPSVFLVAGYPLAKRFTNLPQLVLGFTFNWGILVGFASATGTLSGAVAPVYLAGVVWTLLYDTIYGHQDKKDDIKIGVKSAALYFGEDKRAYYIMGAATGGLLAAGGLLAGYGPCYLVTLGGATAYLAHIIRSTDLQDPRSCWLAFNLNRRFAALVVVAMVVGNLELLLQ